jgi:hypothetical protein
MRVGPRARPAIALVLACGALAAASTAGAGAAQAAGKRPAIPGGSGAAELVKQLFANHAPAPLAQPVDPVITGIYAVLRRPAGAGDALPPINPLGEDLADELRAYFPAEIRQVAADARGDRYFVVPGFARAFPVPAARCLPKAQRRERPRLVERQHKEEQVPSYCIEELGPGRPAAGGAVCRPFAAIQTGDQLDVELTRLRTTVDLVPDGVATVRIAYPDGTVFTAPAAENAFTFAPPPREITVPSKQLRSLLRRYNRQLAHHPSRARRRALRRRAVARLHHLLASYVPTVQWLDAAGNVSRTFPPSVSDAELTVLLIAGALSPSA